MTTADSNTEILNSCELAKLLRISRTTLFDLLKQGAIPAHRVGRGWRFDKAAILDWLHGVEPKSVQAK